MRKDGAKRWGGPRTAPWYFPESPPYFDVLIQMGNEGLATRASSRAPVQGGNPMADILALGISHYPPLAGQDENMARVLRRMLLNPDLPDHLRTPDGWPEPMRAQWGNDGGTASAARHRAELVSWMDKVRAALDAFNPDFVLIWGDDRASCKIPLTL